MSTDSREYINELIHDAAHKAVVYSAVLDLVKTNAELDAKADELAAKIRSLVDDFLIENEAALAIKADNEREAMEVV